MTTTVSGTYPESQTDSRAQPPGVARRAWTTTRALLTLATDPKRVDQILVIKDMANLPGPRELLRLENDPASRAILEEQPRIDPEHIDYDALRALPDGSLGREYVRFLEDNQLKPEVTELRDVGNPKAAYVLLRANQTHDLMHVLTGYTPAKDEEIFLQGFVFAQNKKLAPILLTVFPVMENLVREHRGRPLATLLRLVKGIREGFVRGTRCQSIDWFRWEDHWATPVTELAAMLGCPPRTPLPAVG